MADALALEAGKPWKVVGSVRDFGWPASNLPGVSKSCHSWRHPDDLALPCAEEASSVLRGILTPHLARVCEWAGWNLECKSCKPLLLSLNYVSQRARGDKSLDCCSIHGRIRRFLQTREAFGTYFGIPLRPPGYSTSLWLGQPLPLADGEVHGAGVGAREA